MIALLGICDRNPRNQRSPWLGIPDRLTLESAIALPRNTHTALGPVANTDTKLLIYGPFQKGRVLAQDDVGQLVFRRLDSTRDVVPFSEVR